MKLVFYFMLFSLSFSCKNNNSEHKPTNDDKLKVEKTEDVSTNEIKTKRGKQIAIDFTKRLKKGESLSSLFSKTWTFIYHEDNRCSGTTDGEVTFGSNIKLENKLLVKVKNNSEYAWACKKKESYYYEMTFNLKEKLKNWDRIELQSNDHSDNPNIQENVFFILGGGESDYINIYVDENNLISTFKYGSEDPG